MANIITDHTPRITFAEVFASVGFGPLGLDLLSRLNWTQQITEDFDEYREDIRTGKIKRPCRRCGGKGEIPMFRHVKAGICFRCRGDGID